MSAEAQQARLFVAVPVPADIRSRLASVQRELGEQLPHRAATWTRTENIHLTLRFLGNVDVARIDALGAALASSVTGMGPLTIAAGALGCFPEARRPRVLWVGVRDVDGRLSELQSRIVDATAPFTSQPAESKFVGHLTLARFKVIKRTQAEIIAGFLQRGAARCMGEWRARTCELVRSELSSDGSRYSVVASFSLE